MTTDTTNADARRIARMDDAELARMLAQAATYISDKEARGGKAAKGEVRWMRQLEAELARRAQ